MQVLKNGFAVKTVEHHGHIRGVHILIDMEHVTDNHVYAHGSIDQKVFLICNQWFFNSHIHAIMKEEKKQL
jgi:hypothetical protein